MPQPTDTRWTAIFLILFAGAVGAGQIGKLPGALPVIRADLDISLVAAGWVISTIVLVGAFASIFTGTIADRFGHRRILGVGVLLVAGGSAAGAMAGGTWGLIATRVAEGIGYIALIAAAPTLIARAAAPVDRHVAFAVWSFYMPLGMGIMIAISPSIMAAAGGWRGLWIANVALSVLAFCGLAVALRGGSFAPEKSSAQVNWSGVRATVSAAGPWILAISFGGYSLVYLSAMAFLPTYLIDIQGLPPGAATLYVAGAVLINAPGCLAGGWMLKRGVPPWILIASGYAGMSVCAFGLYLEDMPFALRYSLALGLPFFGGFIPPTVLARAQNYAPTPALYGTTMGLVIQIISLGQLAGPPALAALVSRTGNWQSGAWLTVGACAIGFATALCLRHLDRRAGLV